MRDRQYPDGGPQAPVHPSIYSRSGCPAARACTRRSSPRSNLHDGSFVPHLGHLPTAVGSSCSGQSNWSVNGKSALSWRRLERNRKFVDSPLEETGLSSVWFISICKRSARMLLGFEPKATLILGGRRWAAT